MTDAELNVWKTTNFIDLLHCAFNIGKDIELEFLSTEAKDVIVPLLVIKMFFSDFKTPDSYASPEALTGIRQQHRMWVTNAPGSNEDLIPAAPLLPSAATKKKYQCPHCPHSFSQSDA